ncbi:hypothetical protein Tco_0276821 [Tanacetum coccineum]
MTLSPRLTLQDLSDSMSRMEVRHGMLERMSRRQSYHSDRYARVFEHMVGHYGVQLDGDYAPPGYDEQQLTSSSVGRTHDGVW